MLITNDKKDEWNTLDCVPSYADFKKSVEEQASGLYLVRLSKEDSESSSDSKPVSRVESYKTSVYALKKMSLDDDTLQKKKWAEILARFKEPNPSLIKIEGGKEGSNYEQIVFPSNRGVTYTQRWGPMDGKFEDMALILYNHEFYKFEGDPPQSLSGYFAFVEKDPMAEREDTHKSIDDETSPYKPL